MANVLFQSSRQKHGEVIFGIYLQKTAVNVTENLLSAEGNQLERKPAVGELTSS